MQSFRLRALGSSLLEYPDQGCTTLACLWAWVIRHLKPSTPLPTKIRKVIQGSRHCYFCVSCSFFLDVLGNWKWSRSRYFMTVVERAINVQHCKLYKKKILILPGRMRSPAGNQGSSTKYMKQNWGKGKKRFIESRKLNPFFGISFKCSRMEVITLAGTRVILLLVFPFDPLIIFLTL